MVLDEKNSINFFFGGGGNGHCAAQPEQRRYSESHPYDRERESCALAEKSIKQQTAITARLPNIYIGLKK